jgi:hypothetical protein
VAAESRSSSVVPATFMETIADFAPVAYMIRLMTGTMSTQTESPKLVDAACQTKRRKMSIVFGVARVTLEAEAPKLSRVYAESSSESECAVIDASLEEYHPIRPRVPVKQSVAASRPKVISTPLRPSSAASSRASSGTTKKSLKQKPVTKAPRPVTPAISSQPSSVQGHTNKSIKQKPVIVEPKKIRQASPAQSRPPTPPVRQKAVKMEFSMNDSDAAPPKTKPKIMAPKKKEVVLPPTPPELETRESATKECAKCLRKFVLNLYDQHVNLCTGPVVKRQYDSRARRLADLTAANGAPLASTLTESESTGSIQTNWREKSNQVRATLGAALAKDDEARAVYAEELARNHRLMNKQCHVCARFLAPRAFDGHLEMCLREAEKHRYGTMDCTTRHMTPAEKRAQQKAEREAEELRMVKMKKKRTSPPKLNPPKHANISHLNPDLYATPKHTRL